MTLAHIARELGFQHASWISQTWLHHPTHPCPTPDAYSLAKGGYYTPLWLPHRLPEWHTWDQQRDTIAAQRQREGGRKGRQSQRHNQDKQPPHPTPRAILM